ncbi:MAG: hypothetical protein JW798_13585, partial [Prolixibacteraceae bacterium]|nr:hypothetical protein [Prolixibacteraceae bacterium]
LQIDRKYILFKISNSKNSKGNEKAKDEKKGIGLKNVSKRLKLLYKGKHTLKIEDDTNEFRIELSLKRSIL